MKYRQIFYIFTSFSLLLFWACAKGNMVEEDTTKDTIDTLSVLHSMKGYELYSWQEGDNWYFSILVGTNRIKTYSEVVSSSPTEMHLIAVTGIESLKLVLTKFPEDEYIIWIGKVWLQNCWGGNYGNLQLPPQTNVDDIKQFCIEKNLNLQVTD